MPEGEPLSIFAPGFNALRVPWMAVGSIASSAYGEHRSTLDVDVVAVVGKQDAARFLAVFPETDFYRRPLLEREIGARGLEHVWRTAEKSG
jgi:hypothetical protein